MYSSIGAHISYFSFNMINVALEILLAIKNSSKSIGYILNNVKYPTRADVMPLSSTANKDPLITYLKPHSSQN